MSIGQTDADWKVLEVERARRELRAGRPMRLQVGGREICFMAAEMADTTSLLNNAELLVADGFSYEWLEETRLASLAQAALPEEAKDSVLQLLRHSHLLPIAFILPDESWKPWLSISIGAITGLQANLAESLRPVAEANLPTRYREDGKVQVYRPALGDVEHLTLCFPVEAGKVPLVRVHSSCLTGDLLGSLRCDCGDQLDMALHALAADGGVLCYLNQEGRGIGIANKIRAYRLQEQGQDTFQANLSLGYAGDERQFHIAAAMLRHQGIERIRLLTNNPAKVKAMEELGITVTERVPLLAQPHDHNRDYLLAKAQRFGHLLKG